MRRTVITMLLPPRPPPWVQHQPQLVKEQRGRCCRRREHNASSSSSSSLCRRGGRRRSCHRILFVAASTLMLLLLLGVAVHEVILMPEYLLPLSPLLIDRNGRALLLLVVGEGGGGGEKGSSRGGEDGDDAGAAGGSAASIPQGSANASATAAATAGAGSDAPAATADASSWTSSSSSSSFELFRGLRVQYTFTDRYRCGPAGTGIGNDHNQQQHQSDEEEIPRRPLPDPIRTAPGLVDFFPRWWGRRRTGKRRRRNGSEEGTGVTRRHPLRVVVVGDSIAVQVSQVVDEAIGAERHVVVRNHLVGTRNEQEWTHVSQSSNVGEGGIVVAGMRLRHLLLNSTKEDGPPQSSNLWNPAVVDELLRHEVEASDPRSPASRKEPIGQFDAMVQRIPHGWISLQDITYDGLRENARLAAQLFGIETLVLVNLPLINNVVEYEGREGYLTFLQKRQLIRDFAAQWRGTGTRLRHVLVLELGDLVDELLEWNARLMGFNTSLPYQNWMLGHTLRVEETPRQRRKRLRKQRRALDGGAARRSKPSYYNHKVAHKCAVRVPEDATACPRNSVTYDGMHLCMSTLGGRIVAGMACLVDCGLDAIERDDDSNQYNTTQPLRACEARCNDQFMSTKPVPASMMRQLS